MSSIKIEILFVSMFSLSPEIGKEVGEILTLFCNLTVLNLVLKILKGLRVTKVLKKIKFEGAWGELESKKCFQRQSFTKCLILTLVFI